MEDGIRGDDMSALDMELNETQCKYNKMIDCKNHQCWNCGWNPAVAEKRVQRWLRSRIQHRDVMIMG